MSKNRGRAECFFEFLESFISFIVLVPFFILAEESEHGLAFLGVSMYKSPIEIGESKEDLKIVNRVGSLPFRNSINFGRVHTNTISANDESEKPGASSVEFTLLAFDIKTCSLELEQHCSDLCSMLFLVP